MCELSIVTDPSQTEVDLDFNVISPSSFKTQFLPGFSNVDLKYAGINLRNGHGMQGYHLFLNRDQEITFDRQRRERRDKDP